MAIFNHIEDNAQQTHYFNNSVVDPVSTFQYDALYRLVHATGREFIEATMPGNEDFTNGLPVPFDGSAWSITRSITTTTNWATSSN